MAWTRWAFDSGMSQSGRVVGTLEYSCRKDGLVHGLQWLTKGFRVDCTWHIT